MKLEEFDVLVFSDGSGHADGAGGWAVTAMTPDRSIVLFRMAAVWGTTTARAEFDAILNGLRMALEMGPKILGVKHTDLSDRKLDVLCCTDREDIVLSFKGVYQPKHSMDQWAFLEYYKTKLNIEMRHIGRETEFKEFQEADLQASTARIIMKEYGHTMGFKSPVLE